MAQAKTSRAEFDAKVAVVSDMDWARLAMAIDCEGCVFIQRSKCKGARHGIVYNLAISIGNTDLRLMKWLMDKFPGHVYFSHSVSQRQWSKKICHSWKVFEDRAAIVLQHCLPYMICKHEQAELALAYRELRKKGSKGKRLTATNMQERDAMYAQMRSLNSGVDRERHSLPIEFKSCDDAKVSGRDIVN